MSASGVRQSQAASVSGRASTLFRRAGAEASRIYRFAADRFPLTPLGTLLAIAAWLFARELGQKHQDVVLYVVGLGALGVILVALVLVLSTTLVLGVKLSPPTARLPERIGAFLPLAWMLLAVAIAGVKLRDHAGLFGLSVLILLAVVFVLAVLIRAKAPEALPHRRSDAGRVEQTGFSLPSLSWLPLMSMTWEWVQPEAVRVELVLRKGRLVEEVTFGERGEHIQTVRRILIGDVLGLARLAFQVRQWTPRTVRPALGRQPSAPLLESFSAGDAISHPAGPPDGDLVDMRRYAVGDPMKRILWKVYARTRNLMVRLPERAIAPTRRTLAYLVTGEGDEAAAAVARMAVESEVLGPEWRFSADQPEGAATTEEHDAVDPRTALSLIVTSRGARKKSGEGLSPFLERQASWGGRCVIFAPGRRGKWLDAVEPEIKRRPGGIEVVLGVDGIRSEDPRDRWRRLFLIDAPEGDLAGSHARAADVEAITKRLTGLGATVTVVDRPSGKLHARSARRRRA